MKLAELGKVSRVGADVLPVVARELERVWPGAQLLQFTVKAPDGPQGVSFAWDPATRDYEVSM